MFDVGFWEMAFIGVIALVVIGPERLPGVARTAGLWVGKGRRMLNEVMADVKKEMKEYDDNEYGLKQVKALSDDLKSAGAAVGEELTDITQAGAAAKKEVGAALRKSADDVSESPSPGGGKKTAATPMPHVKKTGDGSYYIYESLYRNREYTIIHKGTCEFCLHGHGRGAGSDPRYTKWHGPFGSMKEARHEQAKITGKKHRECEPCANRIEPRP